MKNCIYFVKHNESGKWYVGSHKNSDNIASKAYMGGGVDIRAAVELYGSDAFHSESLMEFADRNEAYKAEHQLLNHIDAAGNKMSYNRTNNSWPKEGFWKKLFSSKKGPLNNYLLEEFKNKIMTEEPIEDHTEEDDSKNEDQIVTRSYTRPTFQDITKSIELECRNIGYELGLKYGVEYKIEDNINIQRNKMLDRTKYQIHLLESEIDQLAIIVEHNSDDLKSKLAKKEKENTIKYYIGLIEDYDKKTGWYSSFNSQYNEGLKDGMRVYLINKVRLQNG